MQNEGGYECTCNSTSVFIHPVEPVTALEKERERERDVYLWVPPSVPHLQGTPEARGGLRGGVEHDLVLLAAIDCPTPVYGA